MLHAKVFFLEHAGGLCIFILREKEWVNYKKKKTLTLDQSEKCKVLEAGYYKKKIQTRRTRPLNPRNLCLSSSQLEA